MRKLKSILIISLVLWTSCQKKEINCEEFCAIPERHEMFKSFEVEKQFQYFRACPCPGDSISEKYKFAQEISNNEQIIDFLSNKLRHENDNDILIESILLMRYVANRGDFRGRKDVSDLVKETVSRIPDRDERNLIDKIFGDEPQSRRERLNRLAKEIEEKTR